MRGTPSAGDGIGGMQRGHVYVILATVAWSTGGVLQRQLTVDTTTQIVGRAIFASASVFAYVWWVERAKVVHAFRSVGLAGAGVSLFLCVSATGFFIGFNNAPIGNVLLIQAMAPVIAAPLAWLLLKERLDRRSLITMIMAVIGAVVMVGNPGGGNARGQVAALVATFAFAIVLIITRRRQDISMAPAIVVSQVLIIVLFSPWTSWSDIIGSNTGWFILLGVGQMGIGFVLLSMGARLIPVIHLSLISLLEVVLGPIWAWILLGETLNGPTLIGGSIVALAVVGQLRGGKEPVIVHEVDRRSSAESQADSDESVEG